MSRELNVAQEAVADVQILRAVQVFIAGRFGEHDGWVMAVSRAADRLAVPVAAAPVKCNVEGTWLWSKLMDWCKIQRIAPASQGGLFAIASEAHALNERTPAASGIDLERFRPFVTAQRYELSSHGLPDDHEEIVECDELLALIDASPKGE